MGANETQDWKAQGAKLITGEVRKLPLLIRVPLVTVVVLACICALLGLDAQFILNFYELSLQKADCQCPL